MYYFRFSVGNNGKIRADDCETFLERVWEEDNKGNLHEWLDFTPVNLRWSGEDPKYKERARLKTVHPNMKRVFCGIGQIYHPKYKAKSAYRAISEEERQKSKFFFASLQKYYTQWDCLVPGEYQIEISVYSKNARKHTQRFKISWTGEWRDTEEEMFKEIVISKI